MTSFLNEHCCFHATAFSRDIYSNLMQIVQMLSKVKCMCSHLEWTRVVGHCWRQLVPQNRQTHYHDGQLGTRTHVLTVNFCRKRCQWKIILLQKRCPPVVCGLGKKTCSKPKEPDVIFTAVRVHDWRKRYILLIARFIQNTLLFLEPDPEVGHTRLHRFWRQFSKVCLQIPMYSLCIMLISCGEN